MKSCLVWPQCAMGFLGVGQEEDTELDGLGVLLGSLAGHLLLKKGDSTHVAWVPDRSFGRGVC